VKLTAAQRSMLTDAAKGSNVTTPKAKLSDLHALTRRGLIRYEESREYRAVFGVLAWTIEITAAGRAALAEVQS